MAFTDHKISAFTHTISELADQPNLPPDELKARFDACPEELRQAVNGICDDADRLDERVTGIVAGTFGDTITEDMLSEELQAELDAKADQTDVAAQLAAETAARESADEALSSQIDSISAASSSYCKVYTGSYTGDGNLGRVVYLPVAAEAVLLSPGNYAETRIALQGRTTTQGNADIVRLSGRSLTLYAEASNEAGRPYYYIALA